MQNTNAPPIIKLILTEPRILDSMEIQYQNLVKTIVYSVWIFELYHPSHAVNPILNEHVVAMSNWI